MDQEKQLLEKEEQLRGVAMAAPSQPTRRAPEPEPEVAREPELEPELVEKEAEPVKEIKTEGAEGEMPCPSCGTKVKAEIL